MNTLWQDVRYGCRMLMKNPSITAVAIIAFGLGIGANTAIFSVVNAVLLRPLPFKDPERLVAVWEGNVKRSSVKSGGAASYPDFADWRAQNGVFERMAAYHYSDFTLAGDSGEPAHMQGAIVSADLFQVLGVAPTTGRTFLPEEDQPGGAGGARAVILSDSLWRQRFSADTKILGRTIKIDGRSFNIVGVMPSGFQFPIQAEPVELWTTMAVDAETADGSSPITEQRGAHYLNVVARLKPGVTMEQAKAEMDVIAQNLQKQYPDTNANFGVGMVSLQEFWVGDLRPALLILFGAVGCVLLIACANVANLLLARATARYKEVAIRAALGASRLRVMRQLLTESLLLAILGGALALLLALWGTDLLIKFIPEDVPRLAEIHIDGRVLGFTMLLSVLTGVVFGLAPALNASKTSLTESLKEGGRSGTDGARRNRVRSALVVMEVALSLVLLVGAGLLLQSLLRLQQVNPGFNPKNVLTFRLDLPAVKYSTSQQIGDFFGQLQTRIEELPGVQAASAVSPLPLSNANMGVVFETEGRPVAKSERHPTDLRIISPDYFRTMSILLIKGRDFTARDDLKSPSVIIINETLARQYFPNEDPIGKRIKPTVSADDNEPPMRQIIGIVGDVKHRGLSALPKPEVYVPHAQVPFSSMTLVVRTASDTRSITSAVQGTLREMDKDLPLYNVRTLEQYLGRSSARPRFNALLLSAFACVALLLTGVGLYGVMAYSVAQRTHEIGIRMALGAQTGDVLRMVVRHGMTLALLGVVLGLGGAFALTRLMASLLYGVSATDPWTFAGLSLLLCVVAFIACYMPSRRATKVDPLIALRHE